MYRDLLVASVIIVFVLVLIATLIVTWNGYLPM